MSLLPRSASIGPARRAELTLVCVALAWGLTFPLIKIALDHAAPFAFMAMRFPLAMVMLWPLLRWRIPARRSVLPGLLLAALIGISYFAQVVGLQYTTPTRSAFITGLSVILVPLLYPALTRRLPARLPVLGALIAAVGLYGMTDPGVGGLNRGDAFTLITAITYALYIISLEVLTKRYPHQDMVLMQFLPLAFVFAPAALADAEPIQWGSELVWALLLTGPVLAFTVYLQTRYQQFTTATRAAVIFTGEPVFAAMFSYFLVGEVLSWTQAGGALFILAGILIALKR